MLLITQTGSETHPEHQAFETENVTIITKIWLSRDPFFLWMKTTFKPDAEEINEEEMPKFSSPYVETVSFLEFLSEVSPSQSAS